MECVERYAERQDYIQGSDSKIQAERTQKNAQAIDKEVGVLEEAEHAQVEADADDEEPLTHARIGDGPYFESTVIVDEGRDKYQRKEPPVPEAVEEIAGYQQQRVLPLIIF